MVDRMVAAAGVLIPQRQNQKALFVSLISIRQNLLDEGNDNRAPVMERNRRNVNIRDSPCTTSNDF